MIELSKSQQNSLLGLARKTIANKLGIEEHLDLGGFKDTVYGEKCGVFVTVYRRGSLRGCIGYVSGVKPIPDSVRELALAAAFRDPRFSPLSESEYPEITLEISIMSPVERVKDTANIAVGRDGLIVSKGFNRGLLLPQVASEYKWDRETFLKQTCRKAGLPENAWRDSETIIEKFTAQVFGET